MKPAMPPCRQDVRTADCMNRKGGAYVVFPYDIRKEFGKGLCVTEPFYLREISNKILNIILPFIGKMMYYFIIKTI